MTKTLIILLVCCMMLSLLGCNTATEDISTNEQSHNISQNSDTQQPESNNKITNTGNILIAYFSRTGNTETVANFIAEKTGGDMIKIETVIPYPDGYQDTVDVAGVELEENARPELSTVVDNMDEYEVIFIGYPIWYNTAPMAVLSFLDQYDLAGKTVIPFCTHAGSGLGESVTLIEGSAEGAFILEGLAIRSSHSESTETDVKNWLNTIGISVD